MSDALYALIFIAGTAVSLFASWRLVGALERVGGDAGLSEGALGMLAALAADAPEITAAISAIAANNRHIGAGVVLGSNVFNIAALIGVAGIVGGFVALDPRVVSFAGSVAVWIALVALLAVTGALPPAVALVVSLVAFVPYLWVLVMQPERLDSLSLPDRWRTLLAATVRAEEREMEEGVEARRGRATRSDVLLALVLTAVVVGASVAMERSATTLGQRASVAPIVIGALALAVVTSLPNAVAGVYLARRDRGAAVLSTSLNSNSINVIVGLLVATTILGAGAPSGETTYVALSALLLTCFAVLLCHRAKGISRAIGSVIVSVYVAYVIVLLVAF